METLHIYSRVSTTQQQEENYSLESQQESGIRRAEQLGMDYKVWNEGAQSSSGDDLDNRPVLMNLLSEIEEGKVKNVYAFNIDRLSRNKTSWHLISAKLQQYGVKVYLSSGEYDFDDPIGNMFFTFMGAIAQYDNQLRTARFRIGKLQNLKNKGGWMGGAPPFGYFVENRRLVPHSDEKKWVKTIYEMYCYGASLNQIRQELMNNGVKTRRGNVVWSSGSIRKILENTHYQGYYTYHDKKTDEKVTVKCEPILEQWLIDEVETVKKKRSYNLSGKRTVGETSTKQLLTSILKCKSCGSVMGAKVKHSNVHQKPYYYCLHKYQPNRTQKKTGLTCKSQRNISIDNLNKFVWDSVTKTLSGSPLFKERVKNDLFNEQDTMTPNELRKIRTRMKRIEKEIGKIDTAITSLTATGLYSDGKQNDVIDTLKESKGKHNKELNELKYEINKSTANKKWLDWVKLFGQKIDKLNGDQMSLDDKISFLSEVVDEVQVIDVGRLEHEVSIKFKYQCVGDTLIWKNPAKKSLGYTIQDGTDVLTQKLHTNNLVKPTK